MKVKNTAIIFTAYDYQTLYGVKLLADWLNSPTQYARVIFEADKSGDEIPQGIDDIACERSNGVTDFWQVKFTPSPEKKDNHLTWDWLLKITGKTARSRSILKKLSDAISSVAEDKLGEVVFLTNKRPDRSMEGCIKNGKIDFLKIDSVTQKQIINQLGSIDEAVSLFSVLDVQHSEGDYHTLSRKVRSELYKHSDESGIDRLLNRSREWAMFQGCPSEHGWIYLHNIREILSPNRPDPIPEFFTVPEQYCLPDESFHRDLVKQISMSSGGVITLTGNPGLGKSTYLSYLCQTLESMEIPLIRHHYFLSLGDTTFDRLSPRVVAESLLYQISSFHGEVYADTTHPENLRTAIDTCAKFYKSQNKLFVVLVDGLDHVWRDNARDKKPLDEVFRQLLPVLDNVLILVGTQPVDDSLLPDTLLGFSPKEDWVWLPAMTGQSIYGFLNHQFCAGRLHVNSHEDHIEDEIKKAAEDLLEVTNGYPLHVIYSTEFIAQNGKALSSWEIGKLPPCVDNNIETYYQTLWSKLTYKQRDVLYICSGFQFPWPRFSIGIVLGDETDHAPSVDAVSHMLSEGVSGVRPFHESLVVFVQNQVDYQKRIEALLTSVCSWLDTCAPKHLRDAWLWSTLARAGDSSHLRQGISLDWVLDRLVEGFPVKTCVRQLSEAETYAFEELDFAEANKHRALKIRLLNGPEFQCWNTPTLEVLSLVNSSDEALNSEISSRNEYSPTKLATLALALWHRKKYRQAKLVSTTAIDRYRARKKLIGSIRSQGDDEEESAQIIRVGVLTDTLNYDGIFEGSNFSNWPSGFISSFREACISKRDIDLLIRARSALVEATHHKASFEIAAIRVSIIEEADITKRPEYNSFINQKLSFFLDVFKKGKYSNFRTYYADSSISSALDVGGSTSYHDWFLASLCTRLQACGDFSWPRMKVKEDKSDVSLHYDLLNQLADEAAEKLKLGDPLSFDFMCSIFPSELVLDQENWEIRRAEITLKREWIEISSDCHLLTTGDRISLQALNVALETDVFRLEWLRLWYERSGLKLLDDDAVAQLINFEQNRQTREIEETIEYANGNLELTKIAYLHDDLTLFTKHLRRTWDFVLGYGHHKDDSIFEILKAIEYLSAVLPDAAIALLEKISPIVFNITNFTDGDGTRYAKNSVSSLLARLNPQTAASIYDQELKDGEWYYAEETLLRLIKNCDFSTPIVKHLFLTGLHSECYKILQNKIDLGSQSAIEISENVESILGSVCDPKDDLDSSLNSSIEQIKIDPSEYSPDKLTDLIEELTGKHSARSFWIEWYQYWLEEGKELDLIECLLPTVSSLSDRWDDKRYLLDYLFESQKKLNGKTRAFDLLVAAHNSMNGWSEWYESTDDSLKRLTILSRTYPKRIDEFIRKTTQQSDSWRDKFGNLIIPSDKLVYLLTVSNRLEEALELVEAMVESLITSVRNLPLEKPKLDWGRSDTLEEALAKTLVSRFRLPVCTIKLLVIEQLSELLINKHPNIEKLVLKDLSSRTQESECVEVLSLLLVAKDKAYSPPKDLGNYVNARSVLSDILLKDINPSMVDLGIYSSGFSPLMSISSTNHRFDHFLGAHFPQLYKSQLVEVEESTGIPFSDYFISEWNHTFEYCPESAVEIGYFFSSDRLRSTGQFYSQASHRGRSAFLRTIEVAKRFYGMPESYAESLSISALPIEPAYVGLYPQKPNWLPNWSIATPVTQESVSDYISQSILLFSLENELLDLAALSLPIKITENNWIDLTIVRAMADQTIPEQVVISDRLSGYCMGSLLERKLEYQFRDEGTSVSRELVATTYPLLRYGHWHSDLESRGLYVPRCSTGDKRVFGEGKGEYYYYSIDNVDIGYSSYWNNEWKHVYPKEIRSLCGTYTAVEKEKYSEWISTAADKSVHFYACKVKILSSDDSFKEFNIENLEFIIISDT